MSYYIKQGFGESIELLPSHVQDWFHERYDQFEEDISYGNDGWPTFHLTTNTDEYGKQFAVLLQLTGCDDGDDGTPGFRLSLSELDKQGGFGWDDNDDVIYEESGDVDSVNWAMMMFITNNQLIKDEEE